MVAFFALAASVAFALPAVLAEPVELYARQAPSGFDPSVIPTSCQSQCQAALTTISSGTCTTLDCCAQMQRKRDEVLSRVCRRRKRSQLQPNGGRRCYPKLFAVMLSRWTPRLSDRRWLWIVWIVCLALAPAPASSLQYWGLLVADYHRHEPNNAIAGHPISIVGSVFAIALASVVFV
ncbi:hypothetical protein BDZ97DRAFT_1913408 [Flammula alnicola]|nr:hypothetical protein BDZ97DRAFT_1913408 [Flammula alnicola]